MTNEPKVIEGVANAFVAVVGEKIIANAVGSTEHEASVNLDCIELSEEDAMKVVIRPCQIIVEF